MPFWKNDAGAHLAMTSSGSVDVDRIRQRAYELWEQDGCPEGRDMEYWFRAEADLAGTGGSDLGSPHAGGVEGGGARSEPDLAPLDEPGRAAPKRARAPAKAPTKKAAEGSGKAAGSRKPAGGDTAAADRSDYVQQRRTRKKAEG
jgi:hypothetical protein